MLCTACIDCRTGGGPSCCMSRFNWVGGQWSWLLKNVVTGNKSWCLLVTRQWNNSHLYGFEKSRCSPKTLIPEVSSEDRIGYFLQLAGSCAQRICTGRTDVNSEFYREGMDGLLKRLWCDRPDKAQWGNRYMLHDTTSQLLSNSYLQRKDLLFFTTLLTHQIWHLQTIFYLKWNPTLRPLFWQHFRHPEQCEE